MKGIDYGGFISAQKIKMKSNGIERNRISSAFKKKMMRGFYFLLDWNKVHTVEHQHH
jgi:hypothetical protein